MQESHRSPEKGASRRKQATGLNIVMSSAKMRTKEIA